MINIGVVGASGLVGRKMIEVLEERNFPVGNLRLFATSKSVGKELKFKNNSIKIEDADVSDFKGLDIVLFSAGKEASKNIAPKAVADGCIVIDNGSYWRMDRNVPLVVPEVNPDDAFMHKGIIANPNCSTIQLVVVLKPLNDKFGIKRVVVSTYQSISGAGQKGLNQLYSELNNEKPTNRISKHQLAFNTVFHNISEESRYSEEEIKMINETRKILNLPKFKISVTCVRLPIIGGHSESVNLEFEKAYQIDEIIETLKNQSGVIILDDPYNDVYPTPVFAQDKDDVFVGRIRRDVSIENGLNLWIVSDNLRKGAATNAVQIAELLIRN